MKLNSHLIGFLVVGAAVAGWLFLMEKEVEAFQGYRIYKKGGTFSTERLSGERAMNPTFDSLEKTKAWIAAQVAADALKAAAQIHVPWG